MICTKCGQELEEGIKFCTKCGSNTAFGNKFLKITGILFIVFGAYEIISLIIIIGASRTVGVPELEVQAAVSSFTIFLRVINVLLSLFLGIIGVM